MSRRSRDLRLFVVGVVAVLGTVSAVVVVGGRSRGSPGSGRPTVVTTTGGVPLRAAPARSGAGALGRQSPPPGRPASIGALGSPPIQADPELADPALARDHELLLRRRPVFQHLPYRDREIGVDFDRVVSGGRLELLVTYLGARADAVRDLRRLLARYGDPGTAYVERYEEVF